MSKNYKVILYIKADCPPCARATAHAPAVFRMAAMPARLLQARRIAAVQAR